MTPESDFSRAFVHHSPTPTLLVGRSGEPRAQNEAFDALLLAASSSAEPLGWSEVIDAPDLENLLRVIDESIATNSPWSGTIRVTTAESRSHTHHALITPVDGADAAVVQLIETLAFHDDLTGLPNRATLLRRLDVALEHARQAERHVGVLFLDLDRFKVVNDSLGHSAGDALLRVVAARIDETIRPEDVVARLGGDEFVVIVTGVQTRDDVTIAAERIRRSIARPIELGDQRTVITTSIGIALATGAENAVDLIRDADTALYRAKDLGRDRASIFDDLLRDRAVHRHVTEQRLRSALEDATIKVHYQPTVDIASGLLVGVEALVRLEDNEGSLVSAPDFVNVAEESGLIGRIGQHVLGETLRNLVHWNRLADHPLEVSVNVSPRQLTDQRFPSIVASELSSCGLAAAQLSLEITEHALIDASPLTEKVLAELADLGVGLGLDDFGTGFSSLVYLKRYPITFVKIDKSFTTGLGENDDDAAIVKATIALAHSLRLDVRAEGVESEEQLQLLRELGCDRAQGYLISPAVEADGIVEMLETGLGEGNH